jgi:hypothetical protein
MVATPNARRQFYDADYFARGGVERRSGSWDRRSARNRRSGRDRRLLSSLSRLEHTLKRRKYREKKWAC